MRGRGTILWGLLAAVASAYVWQIGSVMKVWFRQLFALLQQAFEEYGTHDGPWLAGAMAYYAAFSVFPLLLVAIAAFGWLVRFSSGAQDAQAQLLALVGRAATPVLATQLGAILADVRLRAMTGGPIGLAVLLIGASGLFAGLDAAFDRLWDVPAAAPGILPALRLILLQRLNAFLMLLALGALLTLAFLSNLVLTAVGALAQQLPGAALGWQVARELIAVAISAIVLAVVYKVLPKSDLRWMDVRMAAILVAVAWEVGKQVLAWIVIGENYSAYGVVGAFIALMAWIYYASILFFVGAEIVRVKYRWRQNAASAAAAG
jgi:membrane protein